MSPSRLVSTPSLFALALALAGCQDKTEQAQPAVPLVTIASMAPQPYAPAVTLTGTIAARIQSDLSFRVSGRMTERLVDVGVHVDKGQVLARIDPVQQQAELRAAQASTSSAEAQLRQASAVFDRQKALLGDGFTTRSNYDQAERALRVAQAMTEQAKAQMRIAEDALSYTELRADAAGVITARNVDVGEVAQAAQVVFTLAQDGPRDAVFEVNESLLLQPSDGLSIDVVLVSRPDIRTLGTVRQVSPTVNTRNGTVRIKIGLDNPPAEMTLGAVVSGTGRGRPLPAFMLPWRALSSADGRPAVWRFNPQDRTVSLQKVAVAAHESGSFVVSNGLAAGDMVVTDGTKLLRPNQVVEISPGAAR
ncbi:efflux RND transporter periplasmic adaptor subunit [Phreatobacter aquaticus]|uniref:Efflux RND transporter periplasmic adaptor subunit n=1 Tax=Phreatobacter aquaticus TaxID=2570229 RepID=A0A4D7QCD3_9HYPH|nr:efflux RND transporter periplasmic adaptor subunit [Phreatobacter aquaticus]QCK85660.1 efflux RND transporter periplasmic adaptor subunit [Phreatobacter aquaticus]